MKKLGTALTALLVLSLAIPAGAGPSTHVGAGAAQVAVAGWLVPGNGGKPASVYVAVAVHGTHPKDGFGTYAMVARGPCRMVRHHGHRHLECRIRERLRKVPLDAFVIDPLLETARLTLKQGRFTHTVSWAGRGDRRTDPILFADAFVWFPEFIYADAVGMLVVQRQANATARLFGRRFASAKRFGAVLYEAASAGALVYNEGPAEMTVTMRGGTVSVRYGY